MRLAQAAGCERRVWHSGYNFTQLLKSARVLAEDALHARERAQDALLAQERGQAMTGATNEQ